MAEAETIMVKNDAGSIYGLFLLSYSALLFLIYLTMSALGVIVISVFNSMVEVGFSEILFKAVFYSAVIIFIVYLLSNIILNIFYYYKYLNNKKKMSSGETFFSIIIKHPFFCNTYYFDEFYGRYLPYILYRFLGKFLIESRNKIVK